MDNALINRAAAHIQNGTTAQPKAELNADAVNFVNDLFKSLMVAYPAWKHTYKTPEELGLAKKSWVRAFMENGISSKEQVAIGMKKARQDQSDFFPSAGKFISWCKPTPEDLGLPELDRAYLEACNNGHRVLGAKWSHPAVYHAGKSVGWFELRNRIAKETRPMFKAAYEDICQRVMKGEIFELPVPDATKLERHTNGDKVTTEQSKKIAESTLAELRKTMGMRA